MTGRLRALPGRGLLRPTDAVLEQLGPLNTEFQKTILMVTHDPHAAEHARSIVHLDKGQLGSIEHNREAQGASEA